jgi:hypothetical protein
LAAHNFTRSEDVFAVAEMRFGRFVGAVRHYRSMRQHYTVSDGRVVPPGKLVFMGEGRWEEPAPVRCPNGHVLKQRQVTVGWEPCQGEGRTGHRTHQCDCDAKPVFTPPLDEPECHCQVRKQPPPVSRG